MATKNTPQLFGLADLGRLGKEISQSNEPSKKVVSIALDKIYSQAQPRQVFEKLDELAESLKALGLQQPITVNPDGTGKYIVEQGERRWRAAKLAGLESIECIVIQREASDPDRSFRQMTENIQRDNMKLYELSQAIALQVKKGFGIREIAKRLGKKESYVSALNAVSNLPPELEDAVKSGLIQDAQAARRLKNLYETHPEEVIRQLKRWQKIVTNDGKDSSSAEPSSISRAQVAKFCAQVEKQSSESETVPESKEESQDSCDSETETGAPVSETESAESDESESLFDSGIDNGYTPASPGKLIVRIVHTASDGAEHAGTLALDVLPPKGKLSILLDTSEERLIVAASSVRIIGVEES